MRDLPWQMAEGAVGVLAVSAPCLFCPAAPPSTPEGPRPTPHPRSSFRHGPS